MGKSNIYLNPIYFNLIPKKYIEQAFATYVSNLRHLDTAFIKIPSAHITNRSLIKESAQSNIPVIISTGMSNWKIVVLGLMSSKHPEIQTIRAVKQRIEKVSLLCGYWPLWLRFQLQRLKIL